MALRKKFFLSVMITLMLVMLAAGVTSNVTTMRSFLAVEHQFFQQDMARVQNRLDTELSRLRLYAADWGAWDSMYFFMEEKNRLSFDDILDRASLRALDIDLLVLLDNNLLPVIAYTTDSDGGDQPLPKALPDAFRQQATLLMKRAGNGAFDDIITVKENAFLVGVGPVLATNRTGTSRGLLLVGTSLKNRLSAMKESLGTDFDILPYSQEELPERSSGEVTILPDENGLATIWQRRGNAAVRIIAPRTIYEKGKDAVFASYLWIAFAGIGILIVTMLLLEHFVLARLKKLREISDTIAAEGLIETRVPVEGNDEISTLSRSFNALLQTLQNLVMDIPDVLFLVDADDTVVLANKAARTALSHDDGSDLKGRDVSLFLGKQEKAAYTRLGTPTESRTEGQAVFEAVLLRIDGAFVPAEVHRQHIAFGDRSLSLLLARDLTERKQLEEHLAKKAYFDDMTGLPNRHAFVETLNRALHAREALSAAVLNMDHFKQINTQVGNQNGDRILITVAERIRSLLKPPAQLYRTGGDEFSVLIPLSNRTENEISLLAERIRRAIASPCVVGGETVFPSASIGMVLRIETGKTSAEVVDQTLYALAQARKEGIGRVGYYSAESSAVIGKRSANILTLQAELNAALGNNEFIPFFQPIHFIDSGRLCGFETLARWSHPKKGVLPPSSFIPEAEHTGFIVNLDIRMMEHAMGAIIKTRAPNVGAPLFFSSNASPLFLRSSAAVESVKSSLENTGADPMLFTVEVTESALIENLDDVHRKLDRLKELGVKIALDDFGTGYSSLQYIHQLPFDYIKLDRSFILRLFHSEKTERMLRTMIAMGRDLGLTTIAEGVETAEQLAWLKDAGCSKVQGYYFSKPVPWDEAEKMIREV